METFFISANFENLGYESWGVNGGCVIVRGACVTIQQILNLLQSCDITLASGFQVWGLCTIQLALVWCWDRQRVDLSSIVTNIAKGTQMLSFGSLKERNVFFGYLHVYKKNLHQ